MFLGWLLMSLYFWDCYLSIYGQLAKLYCCQSSVILPFEIRKRSKPVTTIALSVGGLPNNGPVFVPLVVHLISTLSPFAKVSSCTIFRSGTAAIIADAYFFVPSGPLRSSLGRTGLCITKSGDRISSATSKSPF